MNFYFIHIPKTAGTTIANIFNEYLNMDVGILLFDKKRLKKKNLKDKYRFLKISNHHIPINYFDKYYLKNIIDNNKIFVIVRNPYDRIISVFKFWIKFILNNKSNEDKNIKKLIKKINLMYNSLEINKNNLNYFIGKALSDNKYKYSLDGHILPMYLYVFVSINGKLNKIPNYILKYENLNDDFNKFKNENNLNIPDNIINKIFLNKSNNFDITKKDLNEKSIKLIKNYYKLDFKYFNYE